MSLGLLATPTVTICKAAKMVFNVAPGNFYLSQYLEYQEANGTSATVEALAGLAGGTDAAFITTVLTNLGLADDAGAQAFLESAVAASGRGAALEAAITALNNVAADDATYGAAKTTFDTAIIESVSYSTNTANNSTDIATLTAVVDADAIAESVDVGSSLSLTTGADDITGTAGNDEISGVRAATAVASTDTLDAVDQIDGGAGTDTLFVTSTAANTDATGGARISNVEVVNVRQTDSTADAAINASNVSGAEAINSYLSAGTVTATNLAAGAKLGLVGNGSITLGEVTGSYVDTATVAGIEISGGTGSTTADNINIDNGAGLVSAEISSSGDNTLAAINFGVDAAGVAGTADAIAAVTISASDKLTITGGLTGIANDGSSGNTITIGGAATVVNIGTLDADVDSVDASGLTAGGVRTTLSAAAQSVTGGAGNDRIGVAALAVTGAIDAGEGTDTVIFTNSTNYASVVSKLSGFEVLRGQTAGSYNLSTLSGIEALEVDGGSITFTNLTSELANAVTVLGDSTLVSVNLATASGTADTATVTLDNDASTATAVTVTDITTPNIETLNVVSGDALATGTANVVSDLDNSTSVKTLNVTGTSDLTLSDITDLAANATVDASTFDHRLIVSAGVTAGDTVKGGTANDSVTVAFGQLGTTTSFVGGEGDDTLTVSGNGSDVVDADFASITGVDNLVIGSATSTSVTLQGFAQGAIQSVDKNSDGRMDITAAGLTTTSTVDGSALLAAGIDLTATLTPADGVAANLTVSGGALADTFTLTLDDTADAANDDDDNLVSVTPGNGIDTVSLTKTAADAADIVTLVSTATSVANADIVSGFTVTVDQFDYNGTLTNATATTGGSTTLALAIAAQAAAGTYVVSTDIADSGSNSAGSTMAALLASTADNLSANYDAFEAQLVGTGGIFNSTISGLDAEAAAGESFLIALDNGAGTAVLRAVNTTATGNTLVASELDLVGVFSDSVLLAANFA